MKARESEQKIVLRVEDLLKKGKGKVSPADLAAETGFSLSQINDALGRLIELYEARVTMESASGKLMFLFNYPLQKRGKKTFKEIMFKVAEALWKVFTVIYKASIGIVLIAYTVIFVLILIGLMFASRSNDEDSSSNIGPIIGGIFRGLIDAFTINLWMKSFSYETDSYGNRFKHYAPEKNKGRGFIQSVFSFVFGPDRPEYDPLEDHKEAAAFIRKNNGKITAGHLVALTGMSYDEAEARLAEYASRFSGDLYVNNEGVLIGDFYDMLNKATSDVKDGKIVFYEDEVEPPFELTGNSTGRNFAISAMNTFNMIMSLVLVSFFSGATQYDYITESGEVLSSDILVSPFLTFSLGYFPLVFSILFFVIPFVRYFIVKKQNNKREEDLIRKKLIGAFVRNHTKSVPIARILELARIDSKQEDKVKNVLERLVIELKGEISIDTSGNPIYTFPRLSSELGI